MYLQHFGLNTDPFPMTTKLFFVYQSRAYGETMAHLVYGIEQEEGIILISGGIGTGKTLAIESLLDQMSGPLDPVLVNVTQLNWHELLRYILLEMGEELDADLGLADLVQRVKAVLLARREAGRRVLLIIDEAQHLDTEALEGLRLLMNISPPEDICLQLILVGQPALEEAIARPDLAQLNQRIRVRYRLETLSREELGDYVDHRVRASGGRPGLFRKVALDRIFDLSDGVPRVVNILAARAMLAAFVDKVDHIDGRHVRREDLPPLSDDIEPLIPQATIPPSMPEPAITPKVADEPRRSRRRVPVPVAILIPVLLIAAGAVAWQLDLGLVRTRLTGAATSAGPVAEVATPMQDADDSVTEPATPAATDRPGPEGVSGPRELELDPAANDVDAGEPESAIREPAAETPPAVAPVPSVPQVVVHVASFRDPERARSYVSILESAGAAVFTEKASTDGKAWIRVYLGPFADTDESGAVLARLEDQGLVTYSQTGTRNG